MTTLLKTSSLSKPANGEKIPVATIAYFRQRNRNHAHDLVLKAFREANITQAEIARRLGKRTDVICRLIGAPGNWTLDTVSDLLFAILGQEIGYTLSDPLDGASTNFVTPNWFEPQRRSVEGNNGNPGSTNNISRTSSHSRQTYFEAA